MPQYNNWNVPYSTISFFEGALKGHTKVVSVERTDDIFFTIKDNQNRVFNVLLLNEYCLGRAAVIKALEEFPNAEYIVTASNWNGYTEEAKGYGRANGIGIFNSSEFFGAINWNNPKDYCHGTRKATRYMHIKVPSGVKVYIFGSVLVSGTPKDLDVLVIYKENLYPGATIYDACEDLLSSLDNTVGLVVDATFLSEREEQQVSFAQRVEAVPLERFFSGIMIRHKKRFA